MEEFEIEEKELEILYTYLNLEWDSMTEEEIETWTQLLTNIENKLDEKNGNLRP
jgi:hypothetical protein